MNARGHRKRRIGVVISNRMKDTVVIDISRRIPHPLYGKIVTKHKKLVVDDPGNTTRIGDKVLVEETRPLSKTKRWRLLKVIEKGKE